MAAEIITKEDLLEFEDRLISTIKGLLGKCQEQPKKWLKSYQVRNMLRITPNTLQKLRMDGTLKYTKVGGTLYYNYDDIAKVLNGDPLVEKPKRK